MIVNVEQRERESAARAKAIARLVWEYDGDWEFTDAALCQTVLDLEAADPQFFQFAVRCAFMRLAHELRLVFPDRPAMA